MTDSKYDTAKKILGASAQMPTTYSIKKAAKSLQLKTEVFLDGIKTNFSENLKITLERLLQSTKCNYEPDGESLQVELVAFMDGYVIPQYTQCSGNLYQKVQF